MLLLKTNKTLTKQQDIRAHLTQFHKIRELVCIQHLQVLPVLFYFKPYEIQRNASTRRDSVPAEMWVIRSQYETNIASSKRQCTVNVLAHEYENASFPSAGPKQEYFISACIATLMY